MALNVQRRKTVIAAFLGWTLDAFDFFILVFTLPAIAATFQVLVPDSLTRSSSRSRCV